MPSPLPTDLDQAIAQARTATAAAIEAGLTRLQVEIVLPELKVQPIAAQFLPEFEHLGDKLRVFFPDAGAAALARRDWGEKPYAIRGINDLNNEIRPEESLIVFVQPSSVEVMEVERLCETAGDRPVVLLNPRLEDVATIGIGYAGRQLRERFLNLFESCYYVRPLDRATLFRSYPASWQVWLDPTEDQEAELIAELPQKPVGDELERILAAAAGDSSEAPPPRPSFLSSLQTFLRALTQ